MDAIDGSGSIEPAAGPEAAGGEYRRVQGLRKIFRALGIVAFLTLGCWLIVDAAVRGPGEFQLWIAALLLIGALGLIATWFWSPFG